MKTPRTITTILSSILPLFVLCSLTAVAKITITKPDSDQRKKLSVSFDDELSFLAKETTDALDAVQGGDRDDIEVEISGHDPNADPQKNLFQVKVTPSGSSTYSWIQNLIINDEDEKASYEIDDADRTFRLEIALSQIGDTAIANKLYKLELGFHSDVEADDATETAILNVRFDQEAKTDTPSGLTVVGSDDAILVKFDDKLPTDANFVGIAYGNESTITLFDPTNSTTPRTTTDLMVKDVTKPTDANKNTVCFEVFEKVEDEREYTFKGTNREFATPNCGTTDIVNDEKYRVAVFFADVAGNIVMGSTYSNVSPSEQFGVFSGKQDCFKAGVHSTGRLPFFLIGFVLILGLVLAIRRLGWSSHHLSIIALFCLFFASSGFGQDSILETLEIRNPEPTFGFIELMYGVFPQPTLKHTDGIGVNYKDVFEKPLGITDGPSAFIVGAHWHVVRGGVVEFGPFLRAGIGLSSAKVFKISSGNVERVDEEFDLTTFPIQLGAGITGHVLSRLLSLTLRGVLQWSIFLQSIESQDEQKGYGNLSYVVELNFKLSLNWAEPWPVWMLFYSWGIKQTYLSLHAFYMGKITGEQWMFDSSTKGKSFWRRLGWFVGFTFEV